jgi:DNA-binding MarR family transcriptional regulator
MTGMINRLQQANLVTLFSDPEDKRRTRMRVTEEGQQVYQQLSSSRNEFNSKSYNIYNEQEIIVLSNLLSRLVDHLKES